MGSDESHSYRFMWKWMWAFIIMQNASVTSRSARYKFHFPCDRFSGKIKCSKGTQTVVCVCVCVLRIGWTASVARVQWVSCNKAHHVTAVMSHSIHSVRSCLQNRQSHSGRQKVWCVWASKELLVWKVPQVHWGCQKSIQFSWPLSLWAARWKVFLRVSIQYMILISIWVC